MGKRPARCVAVFGTGSDVGKSIVAAALCRIFSDSGIRVAPYKAQNMSNNSCVTAEGGEIGRAQAVQAECARLEPNVHMNPLLLKPSGNGVSQVVLRGKAVGNATSADFRHFRARYFDETKASLDHLRAAFELVVLEGAGSCAEVNLRGWDIANFRTALAGDAAVILVADIERGGVFAQVIGTLALLEENERALVKGIIINRFRGDSELFEDGREFIEQKTGLPILGVVPFDRELDIDAEDSLSLDAAVAHRFNPLEGKVNIACVRLPHISNFTDAAPLLRHPSVNLIWLHRPVSLDGVDLLILPGSKNVRADLRWLAGCGWREVILNFAKRGGRIVGICGGYQMLGTSVEDPHGVEEEPGSTPGLGLLDVRTVMAREKRLARVRAKWLTTGETLSGYEIHMGVTELGSGIQPLIAIEEDGTAHTDGALSADGKIMGTYLHGLFDEPVFLENYIKGFGQAGGGGEMPSAAAHKELQYDRLAEHFSRHLNLKLLFDIAGFGGREHRND